MKLRFPLWFFLLTALAIAAPSVSWEAPPGWTKTRGGEGGREIAVTTLAASGPGSLAEAIAADGPRTVVFKVAGVIDLNGHSLNIRKPAITIAGETAPSPGVTIIRGGIGIATHDVILRHLRVRPGEAGRAKKSGWEVDGIASMGGAYDVIVDHCSISWSTDENLSASGPRFEGATPDEWRKGTSHRITFHQCLIAEGLRDSTHAKGIHSMGSLIHDNVNEIAIIGNLYLSNNARNPLFKGGARGLVANNYVHNPGGSAITYGLVPDEWKGHAWERGQMSIVGNVIRHGLTTPPGTDGIRFGTATAAANCDAYVHDNRLFDRDGKPMPRVFSVYARQSVDSASEFRLFDEPPTWPKGFKARPSSEVVEWVLANAGARPWERDAVDRRMIEGVRAGQSRMIDSEAEVGGYEAIAAK